MNSGALFSFGRFFFAAFGLIFSQTSAAKWFDVLTQCTKPQTAFIEFLRVFPRFTFQRSKYNVYSLLSGESNNNKQIKLKSYFSWSRLIILGHLAAMTDIAYIYINSRSFTFSSRVIAQNCWSEISRSVFHAIRHHPKFCVDGYERRIAQMRTMVRII